MKKILFFVSLSLMVVTIIIFIGRDSISNLVNAADKELIRFDHYAHDFGRIPPGTTVTCSFRFRNDGPNAISVQAIRSGCGCLAAEESGKPVPPGGDSVINVRLTTAGLKVNTKVFRKLEVGFTSSEIRPVTLEIKAEIGGDIITKPEELMFVNDGSSSPQDAELWIKRDLLSQNRFIRIQIAAPDFVDVREIEHSNDKVDCIIKFLSKKAPVTPSSIKIIYRNDYGQEQTFFLPIRYKDSNVELAPKSYFVTISKESNNNNLMELTRRRLLVIPSDEVYQIKRVIPRDQSIESIIKWRIVHVGKRSGIEICVHRLPQDLVVSSMLDLELENNSGTVIRKIPLGVYIARSD